MLRHLCIFTNVYCTYTSCSKCISNAKRGPFDLRCSFFKDLFGLTILCPSLFFNCISYLWPSSCCYCTIFISKGKWRSGSWYLIGNNSNWMHFDLDIVIILSVLIYCWGKATEWLWFRSISNCWNWRYIRFPYLLYTFADSWFIPRMRSTLL